MAKELPYFKFFVSEWSDGDITLEDFETQGLFINLCAYYWSNECSITLSKAKKKFRNCSESCFNDLIDSGIIKLNDDVITINFLDEQKEDRKAKSLINKQNGAKGGRPKKQTETEQKPNGFISLTEDKAKQKAIREEERREDKKREDKIPAYSDFLDYAKSNKGNISEEHVKAKYESWIENGWKDGNNNPIKNWKGKLRNVIAYLPTQKPKQDPNKTTFASPIL